MALDRTSESSVLEEAEGTAIGMLVGGRLEDPIDGNGRKGTVCGREGCEV